MTGRLQRACGRYSNAHFGIFQPRNNAFGCLAAAQREERRDCRCTYRGMVVRRCDPKTSDRDFERPLIEFLFDDE